MCERRRGKRRAGYGDADLSLTLLGAPVSLLPVGGPQVLSLGDLAERPWFFEVIEVETRYIQTRGFGNWLESGLTATRHPQGREKKNRRVTVTAKSWSIGSQPLPTWWNQSASCYECCLLVTNSVISTPRGYARAA